jgi:hypothetical protein
MKTPARMLELKDHLESQGWRTATQEGKDSVDHPFITFYAISPNREEKVQATWHTRATNGKSYRLFSCMLFRPYRGWVDTNVKKLMERKEE